MQVPCKLARRVMRVQEASLDMEAALETALSKPIPLNDLVFGEHNAYNDLCVMSET
jgi:hypothetical protein